MDTSEKYAKMCYNPHVQRTRKGEPEAGDYYWFGNRGIVVIGFDHLNVGKYSKENPYIKFAMMEEPKAYEFKDDKIPDTLCAISGTYYIYKYYNPIFCPKVDQWLDVIAFVGDTDAIPILGQVGFAINKDYRYYRQFDTMEQKLCAYYMQEKYELFWWHSDNEWIKYEEAQKRFKESWG